MVGRNTLIDRFSLSELVLFSILETVRSNGAPPKWRACTYLLGEHEGIVISHNLSSITQQQSAHIIHQPKVFMKLCRNIAAAVALSILPGACDASGADSAGSRLQTMGGQHKVIALTFDDGPSARYTPQILDILEKNGVHATFFVIGQNVVKFPNLVKREIDDGNCVGNHTWSHPFNAPIESKKQLRFQISRTDSAVFGASGVHTTLFRPPHGWLSPWMIDDVESMGYTLVNWTVDPQDWRHPRARVILKRVEHANGKSAIVLLHDGLNHSADPRQENTVAALEEIITDFKSNDYSFVTIPQLLSDPDFAKDYRQLFRAVKVPAKSSR
jgi:peptidoglycan/xylan/chitin deacetylase (PgdA/CDA1 family)